MAQLVLTTAGSIVGGAVGGPIGAFVGSTIGSLVGGFIDSLYMGQSQKAPKIGDTKVQASTYGKMIPQVYGTARVAGEVIWSTILVPSTTTTSAGGGMSGMGGGSGQTQTTYSVSFAVGLCEGPIGGVLRIWADKKLLVDYRPGSRRANLRGASIRIFLGDETQNAAGIIQTTRGINFTPPFRGLAYVLIDHIQLADFGNHIPQIEAEVTTSATKSYPFFGITGLSGRSADNTLVNQAMAQTVSVGNSLVLIDNWTSAILAQNNSVSAPNVANFAIGTIDNALYAPSGMAQAYMPISKYDGNNLSLITTYGATSLSDDANLDLIPTPSTLKCSHGYLVVMPHICLIAESMVDATGNALPAMRYVGKYDANPALPDTTTFDFADLDGNGNIWCVSHVGTAPTLTQLSLVDNGLPGGNVGSLGANPITFVKSWDLTAAFASPSTGVMAVAYVDELNQLVIGKGSSIILWDITTQTVVGAEIAGATGLGATGGRSTWVQGVVNGLLVSPGASPNIIVVDVFSWSIKETISYTSFGITLGTYSTVYDGNTNSIFVPGAGAVYQLMIDRIAGSGTPLSTVVAALCTRGQLTSAQINVTSLTDTVQGYVVARPGGIAAAIRQLSDAFFFDVVESDWVLKFVKRGSGSVATLTKDDLGAYPESSKRPDPLAIEDIKASAELPYRAEVSYIDPGINYQTSYQDYIRDKMVTLSAHNNAVELAVVMPADTAKGVAEKQLVVQWVSNRTFKFSTSAKWLHLDPTDVITITKDSLTYILRITQVDYNTDGTIQFIGVQEDLGIYALPAPPIGVWPDAVGDGAGESGTSLASAIPYSPSITRFMDIPGLNDVDAANFGFYIATGPVSSSLLWAGTNVNRSIDGGKTYSLFVTITRQATIGFASTVLPDVSGGRYDVWDYNNSVTITPISGGSSILSASSALAVLNGANMALLGGEIIQFQTATANADGSYTLKNLLRGRRGTNPQTGKHAVGDYFVLFTSNTYTSETTGTSELNLVRDYKPASIGETYISEAIQAFADTGERFMPYTPTQIKGSRDGANNLTITWVRQTRIGGQNDWNDGVTDVPLSETSEAYNVLIYNGSTLVRTISTTSPTASYTAAQQTTDFGSVQAAISIVVYQVSSVVGNGFGQAATV